jgi:hypothetical protein
MAFFCVFSTIKLKYPQIEIPLPPENRYHSIFTCPVSKEQSTATNPPMMLACGHVLSKDSLHKLSKSAGYVEHHIALSAVLRLVLQACQMSLLPTRFPNFASNRNAFLASFLTCTMSHHSHSYICIPTPMTYRIFYVVLSTSEMHYFFPISLSQE